MADEINVFDSNIQTRNLEGELCYHKSVGAAMQYADENPDVWKVSFDSNSGERIRLVRRQIASEEGVKPGWSFETASCHLKDASGEPIILHGVGE